MDVDLAALHRRHECERERLDELRDIARDTLSAALQSAGRSETVEARSKDLASLLKKAVRKRYADPWQEIEDKVGLRVIVRFESDIGAIRDLIDGVFAVRSWEDKADDLKPDALGYLGVHAIASLRDGTAADLAGEPFEVQLHTMAQSLWASLSHEMLYKSEVVLDRDHQRGLYRLVALTELIDREATRCKEALMRAPGYEIAQLLEHLERHFRRFTGVRTDRELSIRILKVLMPRFAERGGSTSCAQVDAFVESHEAELRAIYQRYSSDPRHLLISQPESILVFAELERDRFSFADAWSDSFSLSLIEGLAAAWGTALPTA